MSQCACNLYMADCTAEGLPLCEPESSITEEVAPLPFREIVRPKPGTTLQCHCIYKGDLPIAEGEDELSYKEPPTVDEELQLEDMRVELEKKKTRVGFIDEMLSLHTPECPLMDPCVDMQLELNKDNVHPEILKLQRDNHKLRHQVQEMKLSCTAADVSLKHLRKGLCRDLEAGMQLKRRLDQLDSFKRTMEREHVLCAQRYRHLQREKFNWDECRVHIDKMSMNAEQQLVRFVTRVGYKHAKHEATNRLKQTKIEAKKLHDYLNDHMAGLRQRLNSRQSSYVGSGVGAGLRYGSEIVAFLHRNEQLFKRESH